MHIGNRKRLVAELIGYLYAYRAACNARMYDFTQRLAVVIGIAVGELSDAPGTYPGRQNIRSHRAAGGCSKAQA